uniref:Autophagy-related protein 101 n=1 Tax=Ciona savignyi TaxID=51511 RepID=H2ZM43_CIOSA
MNAHSYNIEIGVESGQVEESVLGIFHSILLHRSTGKFHYRQEGTYSVGTVGTEDVDCEFVDFTYVSVASKALDAIVRKHVSAFREQLELKSVNGLASGTITLEFYQKRRNRWPFNDECVPWEIWNLQIVERVMSSENERVVARETAGARLAEKVASIVEAVGRHEFVPKMPTQSDLSLVFETSLVDVQPYLFKIYHTFGNSGFNGSSGNNSNTVGSTVRRLFRDTLTL